MLPDTHRIIADTSPLTDSSRMIGATLAGFERAPAWLRAARRARLGAALVAGLLVLLPMRLLTRRAAPDRPSWSGVAFLRLLLWGLRIRVTVEGALAPRALVVANHLSWTDILVLGASRPTAFVAKSEVRGWPLLGLLAHLHGTVFVERGGRGAAAMQVTALTRALERGPTVLFPEGTTGNGSGVLPFHSTLFAAATTAGVQPLTIIYRPRDRDWQPNEQAAFAWDGDKAFWPHLLQISAAGPVDCRVIAHPPLSGGQHDRKALAKRCRAIIESALPAVDQKPEADTR